MKEPNIFVRTVECRADMEAFLSVPAVCQGENPVWVPPLKMLVRNQLNPRKNPWFQHGAAKLFVAERNGVPIGRISAQIDRTHLDLRRDNTGFFGFFESVNEQPVADALFAAAQNWLRTKGMNRVRGPFSLNINEETGLLVEGFESPPRLMMGHAPRYYPELVEGFGFEPKRDLLAYLVPMDTAMPPQRHYKLMKRSIDTNPGLTFRHLDPKNYDRDIRILVELFNAAWVDNWGFIPMTEVDAQHMAKELKQILIPELVWFAFYDKEPAAMAVALPDLNEMIADLNGQLWPKGWARLAWRILNKRSWPSGTRVPLMGVAPRFMNKSFGSVLAVVVIGSIRRESLKLNFPICEMSWVLEENKPTRRSLEMLGARVYKKYRVYEKGIM